MLDDPCRRQLQLELHGIPALVEALDRHGGRALDGNEDLPE
jgi:hypothetical protein